MSCSLIWQIILERFVLSLKILFATVTVWIFFLYLEQNITELIHIPFKGNNQLQNPIYFDQVREVQVSVKIPYSYCNVCCVCSHLSWRRKPWRSLLRSTTEIFFYVFFFSFFLDYQRTTEGRVNNQASSNIRPVELSCRYYNYLYLYYNCRVTKLLGIEFQSLLLIRILSFPAGLTLHRTEYFLLLRQNANWRQATVYAILAIPVEINCSLRTNTSGHFSLFFCVLLLMDIYLMYKSRAFVVLDILHS